MDIEHEKRTKNQERRTKHKPALRLCASRLCVPSYHSAITPSTTTTLSSAHPLIKRQPLSLFGRSQSLFSPSRSKTNTIQIRTSAPAAWRNHGDEHKVRPYGCGKATV